MRPAVQPAVQPGPRIVEDERHVAAGKEGTLPGKERTLPGKEGTLSGKLPGNKGKLFLSPYLLSCRMAVVVQQQTPQQQKAVVLQPRSQRLDRLSGTGLGHPLECGALHSGWGALASDPPRRANARLHGVHWPVTQRLEDPRRARARVVRHALAARRRG